MKPFPFPLINTHTHAAMVAFRGKAEDLPLQTWLEEHIWPAERTQVNRSFIYEQSKRAIEEMKKNGIFAFCNMYFFEDEVARAAQELKMHAVIGEGILDFPTPNAKTPEESLAITEELIVRYKDDEYVSVCVAPHAIYTVCEKNLVRSKELAKKYDAPLHIHLAETKFEFDDCKKKHGLSPVEYLDRLGLLDKKAILAHCVWVTDKDIDILADTGANVSHCPLSNLKLGSGIAPVTKMIEKGVNVTLGTDGAASSNRLDIWEAGKVAALLQKGITNDPTALPAKEVVKMMTVNGMKALGISKINGKTIADIEKELEKNESWHHLYEMNVEQLTFLDA